MIHVFFFTDLEDELYDQCKDIKVDEIKNTSISECDKCFYNKNIQNYEDNLFNMIG